MNDMGLANNAVYRSRRTVESYAASEDLQTAEKNILWAIKDELMHMKMLDIGVGAGRTTRHFAPLVKEYTGIDYSENMIKACQETFPRVDFQTADARAMTNFKDGTFDFILFSYNGIDYISHEERAKVLMEIRRVGKNGALFCFSTHHLGYIKNFLKVSFNQNIFHSLRRYGQVREILKSPMPYAVIRDGGEDFQLQTYYIKPSEQINALQQSGFKDIRIFLEKTGEEMTDLSMIDQFTQERWLYYLCKQGVS